MNIFSHLYLLIESWDCLRSECQYRRYLTYRVGSVGNSVQCCVMYSTVLWAVWRVMEMWRPGHPSPSMGKCREMAAAAPPPAWVGIVTWPPTHQHTNSRGDQALPFYAGYGTCGSDGLLSKIIIKLKMFIRIHFHLFRHNRQASAQTHSLFSYKPKGHAL